MFHFPAFALKMLHSGLLERYDISSLKKIVIGGSPLPSIVGAGIVAKLGLDSFRYGECAVRIKKIDSKKGRKKESESRRMKRKSERDRLLTSEEDPIELHYVGALSMRVTKGILN